MLETLDARLAQAHCGRAGTPRLPAGPLPGRNHPPRDRRLSTTLARAQFEQQVTLEEFDFNASSKLPAAQTRDLGALRWLHAGVSVILFGPHGAGSRPPHPHGRRSGERRAYSSQTEPPPQRERPWLPAILCGATTMATWPFTSSRLVGFTPIRTDWKSSRGATAPMTCTHDIHSTHTGRARLKHGQSSGLAPLLRRSCSRPTRPPTLLKEPSCARTCASPPPQPPPPP
ncbi:ATP-binding protein [Streptomyces sp. NPDC058695]|uniref:ATP-binding protein n=1 Tax=Streptomyces sp. NPDC058695 TaxID=3346604 RepID=UPI003656611C